MLQLDNPYAWVLVVTAVISFGLMVLIWPRRDAPGARPMLMFVITVAVWSLGYAFELFNTRLEAMLFWTKAEYLGITTAPVTWLLFAMQYSGHTQWTKDRRSWLLWLVPLVVTLLQWTTELHGLVYAQMDTIMQGRFLVLHVTHGPVFWVLFVHSYLVLIAGTFLILRSLARSPQLYRGQVRMMMIGVLAPWVSNLVYMTGITRVDTTPLAFTISGVAVSWAIYRFRLFSIVPVARDLLVETMDDAVLVLDRLGQVVDANHAAYELLGVSDELVGQRWEAALSAWCDQVPAMINAGTGQGEINLGSGSAPRWYEMRVLPITSGSKGANKPGAENPSTGKLIIFHSVQERKFVEDVMEDARDQALQASQMKSRLLANVSHELRTPLNAILGYTEMLVDEGFGPLTQEQREVLLQVIVSTQQVSLFVSDLLDQNLIERGKMSLHPVNFSPEELLDGVRSMMGHIARQKGLQLRLTLNRDIPSTLHGDIRRLQQVMINLVGNAIKYTNTGWVEARLYCPSEENWAIEIRDSGIGIPPEAMDHIFEPFFQVEGGPGRRQGGAGLGLSIVRHLVTMMGGHIEVESQLGNGSTFRVILPLQDHQELAEHSLVNEYSDDLPGDLEGEK
jgi:signal transduction histidine kinase